MTTRVTTRVTTRMPSRPASGITAMVALAVLTLGAVFAATAGPREALATRTQALRQTIAATSPLARTIVATTTWSAVNSQLGQATPDGTSDVDITAAQLGEVTSQLHDGFDQGVVHLAPQDADWAAMTSVLQPVISPVPAVGSTPVKLEITYRQPFGKYMRLVAGRFPASPAIPSAPGQSGTGSSSVPPLLEVVVTPQTARQFGLHAGSTVRIAGPRIALTGNLAAIILKVTGIVVPRDPSATFWTADPTVVVPDLENSASFNPPPYWVGGVFAGPGAIDAVQQAFGADGLTMQWAFPLEIGSLGGQQAQPLYAALNRLGARSPRLTGDIAPMASVIQASSAGMTGVLSAFLATADSVDILLWLVYVSLVVAVLATALLAARMIVLRRSAELTVRRARGASLRQLALTTGGGAALACVPAAVVGVGLAVLAVPEARLGPGAESAANWWPPAALLLVAVCAPAAVAAWRHRLPRRRPHARGRRRPPIRLVAEATACLAAAAGILVFRQQGTQPGSGVNLYTSAAPVLVAIPAVIVVLRVYPVVLRGLLRGSVRRPGATAFLGLARAARTALTPALPAFALVLALSVTAFAGIVRDAVTRAETATSWRVAGADVTITASSLHTVGATIDPAAVRAADAVPGVTHAAAVWQATWTTPDGDQVTCLVVDPAAYAALVAATQTFPQVPAQLLKTRPAGAPQPVLASPQAAAYLGRGVTTLTSQAAVRAVPVRVTGVLSGTPALPGGGAFVIIPLSAIRAAATPPAPVAFNELLLTGANIDRARLTTVVRTMIPGGAATFRSDILNGLTTAPLQHGTFTAFTLALAAAAGLGMAVMLLELALGAAEREATLARLATMGLSEGQQTRVVVLEVLPALVAAAVAAWACALVLPRLVAPAIDLSVFTGSSAPVALTPDVAAVMLPLAALLAVAVAALAIEIAAGRRRRVAASLRAGE
jgi:putative ABC transport system permease protein